MLIFCLLNYKFFKGNSRLENSLYVVLGFVVCCTSCVFFGSQFDLFFHHVNIRVENIYFKDWELCSRTKMPACSLRGEYSYLTEADVELTDFLRQKLKFTTYYIDESTGEEKPISFTVKRNAIKGFEAKYINLK